MDSAHEPAVGGTHGVPVPHGGEVAVVHQHAHPSPVEYIKIGVILAIVTMVEVAIYYVRDDLGYAFAPLLIALPVAKFSLVAMWFMHLKFDSRLFSTFFVGGLALAGTIFIVVLATLKVLLW